MDGNTNPATSLAPFLAAPDDFNDVCQQVGICPGGGSTDALSARFVPDSGTSGYAAGNAVQSGADVTMFAGGNKDDDAMSAWGCVASNNPQEKTNLIQSSSAVYSNAAGELIIFTNAMLEDQQGTSTFGFWLFQDPTVDCDSAGTGVFVGTKTVGDVLLVADVSGGGPVLNAYKWIDPDGVPNNGDECVGNSNTNTCGVSEFSGFNCNDMINFNPATDNVCGAFNTTNISSSWGTILAQSFLEIAINFDELLDTGSCFSRSMAMGRASTSLEAQIKDFQLNDFNTCGSIEVKKEANEPGSFNFTATPDPDDPNNPSVAFDLQTGGSKLFEFVIGGQYKITETGLPDPNWAIADIECVHANDPGNPIAGDLNNGDVDITIGVADNVVCTFTNAKPSISIEKETNGQDADTAPGPAITVGDPVTWTYLVTNTSGVELTNVVVTDDQLGAITCPQNTLAAFADMTCTANGISVAGQYSNLGTVTADFLGVMLSDTDPSHYTGVTPGLSVEKSTNGQDADTAPGPLIPVGDVVTWTYEVTNIGQVTLSNIVLTDDQLGTITCPKNSLAPGEPMTCTANGISVAGQYENLATVLGEDTAAGLPIGGSDPSHYFGVDASLTIEKATNGSDADLPPGPNVFQGTPILWTYEVVNTGNVDLDPVIVTDDKVSVNCPNTKLVIGESMTCTALGTALLGQYENTGTATGTPPAGPDAIAADMSHYLGKEIPPSIEIEKSTNGDDADLPPGPSILVGSTVTWSYVVTNTGGIALDPVTVTDDKVSVTCPQTSLGIGASMTCTATGTAVLGQYENTATATGMTPTGTTASNTDVSHYLGTDIPPPPPANIKPIPTLSEWAMILLSGLLALIAIPALRRR